MNTVTFTDFDGTPEEFDTVDGDGIGTEAEDDFVLLG